MSHEQTLKLNSYQCLTHQQFSNDGCDEKKMKDKATLEFSTLALCSFFQDELLKNYREH